MLRPLTLSPSDAVAGLLALGSTRQIPLEDKSVLKAGYKELLDWIESSVRLLFQPSTKDSGILSTLFSARSKKSRESLLRRHTLADRDIEEPNRSTIDLLIKPKFRLLNFWTLKLMPPFNTIKSYIDHLISNQAISLMVKHRINSNKTNSLIEGKLIAILVKRFKSATIETALDLIENHPNIKAKRLARKILIDIGQPAFLQIIDKLNEIKSTEGLKFLESIFHISPGKIPFEYLINKLSCTQNHRERTNLSSMFARILDLNLSRASLHQIKQKILQILIEGSRSKHHSMRLAHTLARIINANPEHPDTIKLINELNRHRFLGLIDLVIINLNGGQLSAFERTTGLAPF